jgi:polysaccharide biosynthesis protein VpsQ
LFLFLAFLGLVIFWANTNTMPTALRDIYRFPLGDKIGHFVIYGTLAYLLTWAMPFRRISVGRFSLPLGVVIAIIDCHASKNSARYFILRRNADMFDLLAGYLGIYASTWIPCAREK